MAGFRLDCRTCEYVTGGGVCDSGVDGGIKARSSASSAAGSCSIYAQYVRSKLPSASRKYCAKDSHSDMRSQAANSPPCRPSIELNRSRPSNHICRASIAGPMSLLEIAQDLESMRCRAKVIDEKEGESERRRERSKHRATPSAQRWHWQCSKVVLARNSTRLSPSPSSTTSFLRCR